MVIGGVSELRKCYQCGGDTFPVPNQHPQNLLVAGIIFFLDLGWKKY